MKRWMTLSLALLFVAGGVIVLSAAGNAADKDDAKKPKFTIKQVMGKAHKGGSALLSKVKKGTASEADKKLLLELYTALSKNKPKKGDAEAWKAKTDKLVKAAKDLVDDKEGAKAALVGAANCGGCHKAHK